MTDILQIRVRRAIAEIDAAPDNTPPPPCARAGWFNARLVGAKPNGYRRAIYRWQNADGAECYTLGIVAATIRQGGIYSVGWKLDDDGRGNHLVCHLLKDWADGARPKYAAPPSMPKSAPPKKKRKQGKLR